jgi:leucyl-tRNA synthetase
MLSDWNWYRRRGGCDRETARAFLEGWIPMLAPATPHIAEEFWHRMGGEGLLATHVLPEPDDSSQDAPVLAREAYLRNLIDSARNLRELAERHMEGTISQIVIQTTASWKSELARDALRLHSEDFDFRAGGQAHLQSLEIFENKALRGEIFQTWMALTTGGKKKRGRVHTWSIAERTLISGGLDETEIIEANSAFIAAALAVSSLEVYPVGEGEDVAGKASMAFPLEPGIAFL